MRRIMRLFFRDEPPPHTHSLHAWNLSPQQHRQLLDLLSEIGLNIVDEARGPVPLMTFGRRVLERLEMTRASDRPVPPLPHFADALKKVIRDMRHDRLRVMSPTDFVGVGYVYNAQDPDTYPVRSANR
jgi:hypothetical protein